MDSLYSLKEIKENQTLEKRQEAIRENLAYDKYFQTNLFEQETMKNEAMPTDFSEMLKEEKQQWLKHFSSKESGPDMSPLSVNKKAVVDAAKYDKRRSEKQRKKLLKTSAEERFKAYKVAEKNINAKSNGSLPDKVVVLECERNAQKAYLKAISTNEQQEKYLLACEDLKFYKKLENIYGQDQGQTQNVKRLEKIKSQIEQCKIQIKQCQYFKDNWKNKDKETKQQLDQEATKKLYENAKIKIQNVPLEKLTLEHFSAKLADTDQKQIDDYIKKNKLTEGLDKDEPPQENEQTAKFDEMLKELKQLKEKMGGSSNFGNSDPSYSDKRESFFGIPKEACEAWVQNKMKNASGSTSKGLYKVIGKILGVRTGENSDYETAYLNILSMKLLAQHKDSIQKAFEEDKEKKTTKGAQLLHRYARLECHENENGAGAYSAIVRDSLDLYTSQFELAKKENRLEDFFKNAHGVCFENRMSFMTEYAMQHQAKDESDNSDNVPDPGDGSLYIKKYSEFPTHDKNAQQDPIEYFSVEFGQLMASNGLTEMTFEQALPHFKRLLADKMVFPDGMCTKFDEAGQATEEKVPVDDAYWEALENVFSNILCIC